MPKTRTKEFIAVFKDSKGEQMQMTIRAQTFYAARTEAEAIAFSDGLFLLRVEE